MEMTLPRTVQVVQIDSYGDVDVMQLRTINCPLPAENQVLVRVKAAGVGPWDAWIRAGKSVLPQPLPLTLGSDIAGTIVRVGERVGDFAVGDDIFGVTNPRFTDGYGEYALADAVMVARKPARLNFAEAASIPVIAVTAWQMLHDYAQVRPSQRVLVHGGAGNVGAYAVQFASQAGAYVIATASNAQADYVRSLGASEIVEARTGSFDAYLQSIDVVIDTVGGEALESSYALMKTGGVIISAVAEPDKAKAKQRDVRSDFLLVAVKTEVLHRIGELVEAGRLVTRVGEVLSLRDARRAHLMLEGAAPHLPGKIVLTP